MFDLDTHVTFAALMTSSLVGLALLAGPGCGEDLRVSDLGCDAIGWELGVSPERAPAYPELAVECRQGWGNEVETRPDLDTRSLPNPVWRPQPHPEGGWLLNPYPFVPSEEWAAYLEARGFDWSTLIRLDQDGESVAWAAPSEVEVLGYAIVGAEVWTVGGLGDGPGLARLSLVDGGSLGERSWEPPGSLNSIWARPGQEGAWVVSTGDTDDEETELSLWRMVDFESIELVAQRTVALGWRMPFGRVEPLPDGGVAWSTREGFEVLEADGSVRWQRDEGQAFAAQGDTLMVSAAVEGADGLLSHRIEQVAVADGSTRWAREHKRYDLAEGESCGPEGCFDWSWLRVYARPEGGYWLAGAHPYPSESCGGQPLVMAITEEGEVEWAHRVESCGFVASLAERDGVLEVVGSTRGEVSGDAPIGSWLRRIEL